MKPISFAYILHMPFLLLAAGGAQADMERARDLMEAQQFIEARTEFEIYARSGNAEAEELIGVMYALGL